jgi:pimeloyl-ACP methyl ester carboxylesterase
MVEPLRHRQTKGAETDMPGLPPPRHFPTLPINAFLLAQHLPDAQLVMYPDASHGAQSQHADVFLQHAGLFLDG